ncbi:hypothetical protein DEO72_LG6g736 [Vigna unguiculata]|uniref:Uncharacterized protein n=1 Tax=Vigna unguiculata TaxID=3917 RepID=A0A4D6M847_VIGUN|nr:hypothetical protein DEO72_LG6g736 [Vigna unguiculata]
MHSSPSSSLRQKGLAQANPLRLGEGLKRDTMNLCAFSLRRDLSCLSENNGGTSTLTQASSSRLRKRSLFWAKGSLAQARRSRPSENSRNLQYSLKAVSPKREPVA